MLVISSSFMKPAQLEKRVHVVRRQEFRTERKKQTERENNLTQKSSQDQSQNDDQGWTVVGGSSDKKKTKLIKNSYTVFLAKSFFPHFAPSKAGAQQKSIKRGDDDDYVARGETNTVLEGTETDITDIIGNQPRENIEKGTGKNFNLVLNVSRWVVRMRVAGSDGHYEVSSVDTGTGDVTIKGYIERAETDPPLKLVVTGIA